MADYEEEDYGDQDMAQDDGHNNESKGNKLQDRIRQLELERDNYKQPTPQTILVPKHIYHDVLQTQNEDEDQIKIAQMKLPSSLRAQSKKFDAQTYQIEDQIQYENEVSRLSLKEENKMKLVIFGGLTRYFVQIFHFYTNFNFSYNSEFLILILHSLLYIEWQIINFNMPS